MKTISDEANGAIPEHLLKIVSNKNSAKILKTTTDSSKSAYEISKDCEMSLTTVYRELRKLNEINLVKISGSIDNTGKKHFKYESKKHVYCKCAGSNVDLSSLIS